MRGSSPRGPEFIAEAGKRVEAAKKVAEAVVAFVAELRAHQNEYIDVFSTNGKEVGKIVGEEIGREIRQELTSKTAAEIGKWVGFIIGRVMFEVIFLIVTEGLGMAGRAGKVGGEGCNIGARIGPRVERFFSGILGRIKSFWRARLGLRAAQEGALGGMAGSQWAHKFSAFWRTGEATPRLFSVAEVETWTAKIAARMKQLGIPEANIGVRGIAEESGKAFTATGTMRGGNLRGRGISVHGSVENPWPNFPEWNAASIDARIDAVIAHEWMEFNDLTHFETVELGPESTLPISPEGRKLLEATRKHGLGSEHLANEP
jgi:hypothetical protein